ncbi:CPBP family intramembrane glutamic endopeptidase [Jeotgalibacillus marinus]|uniref:CPBP family intramembrane glutamic endopeptidase n=1 Tax=Jeotgalibacillus marinus TaxID=86667 RepID=A0ABV3Q7C5_9BACL
MNRTFLIILIAYIVMQLSGIAGIPMFYFIGSNISDGDTAKMLNLAAGYWIFFSFFTTTIITLLLVNKHDNLLTLEGNPATSGKVVLWSFLGIFLAFFSQAMAGLIQTQFLGIDVESENTASIIDLMSYVPIAAFAIAVLGPILEEIVFRGVIFGWLYRKYNFFISGMLSALIFGVIHMDFTHILMYTAMGFAFAFLYAHTKRIIVPIIAHISINTFVVFTQFFFADQLQEMIERSEALFILLRACIGGVL